MKIDLIAFGIAKDILKTSKMAKEVGENASIHDLKSDLVQAFPEFGKLASLRFAVNTEYVDDDYRIRPGDEIVIIPPVSGG